MKKNEKFNLKNAMPISFGKDFDLYILPIVLTLVVVPLIVRLKVLPLDDRLYLLWNGKDYNTDFFSYYKGVALISISVIMVFIYFWRLAKRNIFVSDCKPYYFLTVMLSGLAVLSSLLSSHSYLSMTGAPDRYEGIYIWICYFIVFFYAMNYKYKEETSRILIYSVYLFTFLVGILGLSQYMGKNLFESKIFKFLLIPVEYQKYSDTLTTGNEMRTIYGTSYHYNYMGSLASMLFAFSLIMALFDEDKKIRLISVISAVISLFLLFGSTARSGLVALVAFILVMLLFFSHKLFVGRKIFVIGGIVVCFIGVFSVGNHKLFQRIPSLLSDVQIIFSAETGERDHYRQEIFLKNVDIDKRDILIETTDYSIRYKPDQDVFYDEKNKRNILYHKEKDAVWRLEDPYQKITLGFFQDQTNDHRYIKFDDGKIQLYFKQTKESVTATNPNGMEISLDEAPAIGFVGKEKLGSARGYIWSRTIPLLSKALLFGYGADTFLAVFPQGDIYAKLYAYENIWMIVDKPHNLYLQMAINFGVLFVIFFISLVLLLGVRFFRKYKTKIKFDQRDVFAIACFMSVVPYLAAGFFNDSILSVAPIFWVFLGLSIALSEEH